MPAPSPPIRPAPTSITAFVGQAHSGPFNRPVPIGSVSEFERVFGTLQQDDPLGLALRLYLANGGEHALVVRVSHPEAIADPALESRQEGLWALDRADPFNLLCIPPPSLVEPADISVQTRLAAARYCEARRALFIADPLTDWEEVSDILSGPSGLASPNWGLPPTAAAAVYVPRLHVDVAGAATPVRCAPCGAVAGVMARIDRTAGPWLAAAGPTATLRGVTRLSHMATEHETGALAAVGVNTLRMVPQAGPVIWGSRTLAGEHVAASEFKYVPVRRTALHLEASIERGTSWAADETNDERLWEQIRDQVGDFLHALFRYGAFQGTTPRDAFFVRCDATTMTSEDIVAGRLRVVVGFAPLKPAEFVVISVTQAVRRPPP